MSDKAATATTEEGAKAASTANSSPKGTTSAATARQPAPSSGGAKGARRVARQIRDMTKGMPAKVTRACRLPAATPFHKRGRPR